MRSKTSCFNGTLFKKNLTRFAPVWILYIICLLAGLFLTYTNYSGERRVFWFAANLAEDVPTVLVVVNLFYALLVAQLLFGDLYNSRMCNALHALPIRREGYMVTNLLSGLCFSLVPTAVMTLAALPLLAGSIVVDAWKIPFLTFASANLGFCCFFGIAVFSALCVGNRFTMVAAYGLLNFGAALAYFTIDALYKPLMYGFVTPELPFSRLTPIVMILNETYYDFTSWSELVDQMAITKQPLESLTASYTLTGEWYLFFLWAGVGLALMAAATLLYRKRHLECAGDAVAFRCLVPVFQVLCSLFTMMAVYYCYFVFFGRYGEDYVTYLFLALGLIIGWFVARMLIERTTRVFQLKSLPGLGALILAVALTFVGTHFDLLGIERRVPDLEDVESVCFSSLGTGSLELTEESEIADVLRFHTLALQNRNEDSGFYVRGYDGTFVQVGDTNDGRYDPTEEDPEYTFVTRINLIYTLKNGNTIHRNYNIWTEQEEGTIVQKYLSRWEALTPQYNHEGVWSSRLDMAMKDFRYLRVESYHIGSQIDSREEALSFLEAVKADCAAGTMIQDAYFHQGYFRAIAPVKEGEEEYWPQTESISVHIRGEAYSWYVNVYPDCENTMAWLRERNLLDMEVIPSGVSYWMPQYTMANGDIIYG